MMKTIFTVIFVWVFFIGNLLGASQENNNTIKLQTVKESTKEKRPKSIHPQSMITAYYNIEQKIIVVEFVTNQGVGTVELKDSMGNSIERKTVDTSVYSFIELPLPTQPGEYTLLISTEILTGIGCFSIEY